MTTYKKFLIPFATSGSKTAIPDTSPGDGSISYTSGYGPNYALDPSTDPAALFIERDKLNELLYDITNNLNSLTTHGIPDFITSAENGGTAFTYGVGDVVRYDPGSGVQVYRSLVATNTALPTVSTSWLNVITAVTSPTAGAINGNLPTSMTGSATTASIAVSAGQAANSTGAVYINGTGYTFLASNGNNINGYQGGTTLPNSSTIHMYLCTGSSGTGVFASTSLTPTLPTGYNSAFRRIFSFNTTGAGAPIPYTAIETEGGSMLAYLATQVLDINTAVQGTSRILYALTVPAGIRVAPLLRVASTTASSTVLLTSGDETDVAPGTGTTVPMFDVTGATAIPEQPYLTTNTSGQVGARGATTGITLVGTTRGFRDFRRA